MIFSGDAQVRHVYLDVPHSANVKPSWYGKSVGHYEGDTLVVDTIGLNDKTFVDNYRTPHTDKLHVVERYKLVNDGKTLQVTFRVEDPDTFYKPWSAIGNLRRVKDADARRALRRKQPEPVRLPHPGSQQAGLLSAPGWAGAARPKMQRAVSVRGSTMAGASTCSFELKAAKDSF